MVICDGFAGRVAATAAHAQAFSIDLLEICLGIWLGFACDL